MPTLEHATVDDFRNIAWWFHRSSDEFPTIIIAKRPDPSSVSCCVHRVFIYNGQCMLTALATHPQICARLHSLRYDPPPDHFV